MGEEIKVRGTSRFRIDADGDDVKTVTARPGTASAYYGGESVSAASYDGVIAAGETVTLTQTKFFRTQGTHTRLLVGSQDRSLSGLEGRMDDVEAAGRTAVNAEAPLNVRWPEYGVVADGSTDDTAAFNSARTAAGTGGRIYVPGGTYRVGDWAPLADQTVTGDGQGSILKAKAAATFAVDLSGLFHVRLKDLTIDGNAKASGCVRMRGHGGQASYGHVFESVETQNGDVHWDVQAGTPVEVDKNLWIGCSTHDGNTAFKFDGSNSQSQIMLNCPISGFQNYGIRILGGDVWFMGADILGIVGTPGYAIYLEGGANIRHLCCQMVVFEGVKGSVIGDAWPEYGVHLERCALNADLGADPSDDPAVELTGSSGYTRMIDCRVDTGNLKVSGDDHMLWEQRVIYETGAAYEDAGTNNRRYHWDNNGFDLASHDSIIRALVASSIPFTVRGKASQSGNLTEWKDSADALMTAISENGYFTTRKVAAPADGELAAGEMAVWLDPSNGAAKLMVKAKETGGTVRTGSVNLS